MRPRHRPFAPAFLVGFLLAAQASLTAGVGAAPAKDAVQDLATTVAALDRDLFDAFNAHQLDQMMGLFADDLEFYHDKDGLETYAAVKSGFEKMFASNNGIRRELVPNTIEVYPLPGWGALEEGSHKFCHQENGENICGTFKFVILWRQGPSGWKAARVMSFGH